MPTPDAITRLFSGGLDRPALILAPMAGVTDLPFRLLARHFGADLTVSEMIASQAMIRNVPKCLKLSSSDWQATPLAIQIAGSDPHVMAKAAVMQADLGAEIIDINMGCPVKKIVATGSGAALLLNESLAGRIMESVVKAVQLPVTVKIRLGWDHNSRNGLAIARIAEQSGIRCLAVHGRTRAQLYAGQADWDAIGAIKNHLSIPVIGNGDVKTPEQAFAWWKKTQVDGIMIGRAALGRPWIFQEMFHFFTTGQHLPPPDRHEQTKWIMTHFQAMIDHHGPHTGHLLARKHLAWFTKWLPGGAMFRDRINHAPNAEATRQILHEFLDIPSGAQAA